MAQQAVTRRPSDETITILRTLVAFPSVSRDSNLGIIEWIGDYLRGFGVESRVTRGPDPAKANLFATIGSGQGGIVLSGHTDVVPIDGQNWSTDPFELVERDGRLFGRGTADMKGFVATVLAKVPVLLASKRGEPVHLAFSFDEEIGCAGVGYLIADLAEQGIRPSSCIVGEPSNMVPVIGHKSGSAYRGIVTGLEAHASLMPRGVNAIEYGARLVEHVRLLSKRLEREEQRHNGFEVPYSTMQTTVMAGGQAGNIVPGSCSFQLDVRTLPWTDPDQLIDELQAYADAELVPEMRAVAPEANIELTLLGRVPGFAIEADAPLVRYVQRLSASNAAPGFVTFGSEAGLFQQAGIPSVICGPGSMDQGHQPDEYVTLEQLALCEDFLDRLASEPLPPPA